MTGDAHLRDAVRRPPSFWRTLRAVAGSFIGVRKSRDLERDVRELNPLHVVVAGIATALIFVFGLVFLVDWVIGSGVAR
ncbi:MAG: DUF2970 domain-containing protein [Pseudomonadota bacterium]|nr:DUF2970 domain-containing protein [Pseudomonadota bacterium]